MTNKSIFFLLVVFILFSIIAPITDASEQTLFGPKKFEIGGFRLHISRHSFSVQNPGDGLLTITKNAPEQAIRAGFLFFNREFIPLSQFLSGNDMISAELQGYISRPDGSVLGNLEFSQDSSGNYKADIKAIGSQGLVEGLWEVHVFAKSHNKGIEILRDAQTSFGVNLNTAKFDGQLQMSDANIKVGVQVGLEGRYEVRGVLMGTDANTSEQRPIAMSMAADWLKAGSQTITLPIDEKLMQESGLIAPFSIKNVQLTNQTYLAPVQLIKTGIKLF